MLSPYFFSIFVDDIVNKITECNLGCYIRNICTSIFLYADDTIFLSPSVSGLQSLLRACEMAIQETDMEINASKTVCMRTGPRYTCARVTLCNGTQLQWVDTSGVLRGPCACPPPLQPTMIFYDGIFGCFTNFFFKTSKFRHSVTKKRQLPTTGALPLDPTGELPSPRPPGTLLSHILNTPLVNTYKYILGVYLFG